MTLVADCTPPVEFVVQDVRNLASTNARRLDLTAALQEQAFNLSFYRKLETDLDRARQLIL